MAKSSGRCTAAASASSRSPILCRFGAHGFAVGLSFSIATSRCCFSRSWLGKEDHGLEPDLRAELPGVLNWALDGLKRLAEHDRFTRPPGADEALVTLQDLASPVAAFVRDRCNRNPKHEVAVDTLYTAYRSWTDDNGRVKSTKQVFGRDLRAAVPGVRVSQIGPIEDRTRVYRGVGLQPEKRGE
jgi:putative DNA primase/helicase